MLNKSYPSVYRLLLLTGLLLSAGCRTDTSPTQAAGPVVLKEGTWRATLQLPAAELPFLLEVEHRADRTPVLYVINGAERLALDEVVVRGDTLRAPLHIFDAEIVARITPETMEGYFEKLDTEAEYKVDFAAEWGKSHRFAPVSETPAADLSGTWDVTFREGARTWPAVGIFQQKNQQLSGSFATPTGDYRYLDGVVRGDQLQLSTFDGSHLYVFTATLRGDSLVGTWESGLTGHYTWTARRNPDAALPDADTLTHLKAGYDRVAFALPNVADGQPLSLDDARFRGKVVVVQIFGTWCPNCMDETAFLAPWYRDNKERGVEIVGMAFENKDDLAYARRRIQKVKDRFGVDYPFVFAGNTSEAARAAALPAVDHIMSFPTTLFIDRQGKVRRIHTGFSGPGTGALYEEFVREFNHTIDELVESEGV